MKSLTISDLKKYNYTTAHCFDLFYELVKTLKPEAILEIGLGEGGSTRAFLIACRDHGGHLYTIEINPNRHVIESIAKHELNSYWTLITGDSREIKWDKNIDILFIDSDHTPEVVEVELNKYLPYLKRHGVLLVHDMNPIHPDHVRSIHRKYIAKVYEILPKYIKRFTVDLSDRGILEGYKY